ncbi:MAG TPA: tRNA (adenosine(37)-N6)-dimethylallyltransferase MiaA [Candidatus Ozemobacteraceae bacterium]|mgnify:CR=1 FL=1|nr:tRNA (adenosine(37)-N6)-dimethylallyltransferase MiaA [Candidatus Ozemobacteraceae bacterium]
MPSRPLIAVLGPTACGKSALALELARRFGLEIVNCDSRQVYREMEIGTAKPGPDERAAVPHHLFDLVGPDERFSAGEYARQATACCESLWAAGKVPLLVGGTGFYYDALVEGLPEDQGNPALQRDLQERLESEGLQVLLDELDRLDPAGAASIDRRNPRRVLRALELVLAGGRPLADLRKRHGAIRATPFPILVTLGRETLHERIARRIDAMLSAGLADEARSLIARFGSDAPGLKSIGYAEWTEPHADEAAVREAIVAHTRQYAKRQETWFRKRPGGAMHDLGRRETTADIIKRAEAFLDR